MNVRIVRRALIPYAVLCHGKRNGLTRCGGKDAIGQWHHMKSATNWGRLIIVLTTKDPECC